MKTRVQACCNKETFANEVEIQRRFDRIVSFKLSSDLPTGIEQCRNGWHLKYSTKDTGPSAKVRAQVEARDGNRCVKCGQPVARDEDSIHHRLPRGRGGGNELENLLLLCGSGTSGHHGWVEKNRAASYKLGYLVESGINPADVPVIVAGRGWRWPSPDGGWLTAEEYGAADPGDVSAVVA